MSESDVQRDRARPLPRLAQQLDLDGQPHDIAPQIERMRLFEPDKQIDGQTYLDLDD